MKLALQVSVEVKCFECATSVFLVTKLYIKNCVVTFVSLLPSIQIFNTLFAINPILLHRQC
jgi:hypothetical protein